MIQECADKHVQQSGVIGRTHSKKVLGSSVQYVVGQYFHKYRKFCSEKTRRGVVETLKPAESSLFKNTESTQGNGQLVTDQGLQMEANRKLAQNLSFHTNKEQMLN